MPRGRVFGIWWLWKRFEINDRCNKKRRLLRFFGKPLAGFLTADFFTRLESRLLPGSRNFQDLIEKFRPELLITGTPGFDSWEAELILLARRARLPSVSVNFSRILSFPA